MSAGDWKEAYQAVEAGNYELVEYHVKSGIKRCQVLFVYAWHQIKGSNG